MIILQIERKILKNKDKIMANLKKIVECVPNFSEGRNMAVIKQITDEIEKVKGIKLDRKSTR